MVKFGWFSCLPTSLTASSPVGKPRIIRYFFKISNESLQGQPLQFFSDKSRSFFERFSLKLSIEILVFRRSPRIGWRENQQENHGFFPIENMIIWGFPEIEVPPVIIYFSGISHEINQPAIGVPPWRAGNPHMDLSCEFSLSPLQGRSIHVGGVRDIFFDGRGDPL